MFKFTNPETYTAVRMHQIAKQSKDIQYKYIELLHINKRPKN